MSYAADVLARRSIGTTAWVLGAVALLVGASLGVRVLPLLTASGTAAAAVIAVLEAFAVRASEIAIAVAVPLGAALAAAEFGSRGEARACLAMGASPLALAVRMVLPLTPFAIIPIVLGAAWGDLASRESVLAARLVEGARAACNARSQPISAVPLVPAAWLCGNEGQALAFTTANLVVRSSNPIIDGDFQSVSLADARFDLRGPPIVHVHVDHATIRGADRLALPIAPWSLTRSFALALAAIVVSVIAVATMIADGDARKSSAILRSGAMPIVIISALIDRVNAPFAVLLLVPASALATWLGARIARLTMDC